MNNSFLTVITPFGEAICTERVESHYDNVFWICWQKETGICFWWTNQEIRWPIDLSDGRYSLLPFKLSAERIAALDHLGQHHKYWRENIKDKQWSQE